MNEAAHYGLGRRLLNLVLWPLGYASIPDYHGVWVVEGEKVFRKLVPCGYRIARRDKLEAGTTALQRLVRKHFPDGHPLA